MKQKQNKNKTKTFQNKLREVRKKRCLKTKFACNEKEKRPFRKNPNRMYHMIIVLYCTISYLFCIVLYHTFSESYHSEVVLYYRQSSDETKLQRNKITMLTSYDETKL